MAKNNIKGITVEIGGDTVGLQKALTDVNKKSNQLNSELREVERGLKLDPTSTILLAQKQQILAEQVRNTSAKLQTLKSVQSQVEQQYKNGDIGADAYRAFRRELVNTENRLSSLQSEQEKVAVSTDTAKESTINFSKVLSGLQSAAKGTINAISTTVSTTVEGITTAVSKVTEGLVDVGQKALSAGKDVVNMVDSVASAGDAIDKSSQAAGMSAEAFQEWGYVLQRNGASADSLSTWMKKLNNNVDDAVSGSDSAIDKFSRLGISVDDLQNKSREDVFSEVITALQGMENESERAAAVNDLLGGSATDLGALLNSTAEDTQALRDNAQVLGLVMSDTAVADSAAYEDALLDLQSSITGVKNSISAYLLPSFTEVMQGMTGLIIGTDETGDTLQNGMSNVVKSVSENVIPKITTVVSGLSETLLSVAPDLVGTVSELINSVTTAMAENSPMIASVASDLIKSLADGLVNNSWTVMNAFENILQFTLKELPNVISTLIGSAGDYVGKVINFLVDISAIVMNALPDIITELISKISDTISIRLPQIISGLTRLMSVVAKSLPNIIKSVIDELPKLLTTVLNSLKDNVPVLLDGVIEMAEILLMQLTPILSTALPELISIISELIPEIITDIVNVIFENLPIILEGVSMLVMGIVNALPSMIQNIIAIVPTLIVSIFNALSNSLPSIIKIIGSLIISIAEVLPTLIQAIVNVLPELIDSIIVSITTFLPVFIEAGITLFTAIVHSMPKIINGIVEKLPEIIDSIMNALLDALPLLIDCGVDLFLALIENLPIIIMEIQECIPQIIEGIAKATIELFPRIVTVGMQLFMSLVEKLPDVITKLANRMPEIVTGLTNKLKEHIYKMVDIGKNLVEGIWDGIKNAKDWLIEKISSWCDTVTDSIKDFFGIHSPSTLFRDDIGNNLALGIGEGFADTMSDVSRDMQNNIPTAFDINPSLNLVSGDSRMQTLSSNQISSGTNVQTVQSGSTINFTLQIDKFNNTANTSVNDLSETITTTLYELIKREKLGAV